MYIIGKLMVLNACMYDVFVEWECTLFAKSLNYIQFVELSVWTILWGEGHLLYER